MSIEQVETLIIGGGQAGLAMSEQLSERGRPHVVLERHRIAERWRTERWDGLRFQAPNNMVRLSDFSFPHTDPDAFASATEIVDYITAFAKAIAAPVRCGLTVKALRRADDRAGFLAETSAGPIEARNVVIATGPFQRPVIPALLPQETEVFQVHSCGYRNPDQLPDGAVLVVGSGASGAQIAEELRLAGRTVYLSVSRHRRLPRRYRGHDFRWWWAAMGTLETPLEKRGVDQSPNVITGAYGGYTIDFRRFAAQGTVLLGRAEVVRDGVMSFAPDLLTNLAHGDAAYTAFLDSVDAYASGEGIDAPEDPDARMAAPDAPCVIEPIRNLNPRDEGIMTVIWATGYTLDFGWIGLPVFNERGMPIHRRGVTDVQGFYFLGLQWLSRMESGLVYGVARDAAHIADRIDTRD